MSILHIIPEFVWSISGQLAETAVSLQTTSQTLTNTAYALSDAWQGPIRDQFLGEFQPLNQQLAQLADEARCPYLRVRHCLLWQTPAFAGHLQGRASLIGE